MNMLLCKCMLITILTDLDRIENFNSRSILNKVYFSFDLDVGWLVVVGLTAL